MFGEHALKCLLPKSENVKVYMCHVKIQKKLHSELLESDIVMLHLKSFKNL